jgi:hypothetical protein
LILPKINNLLQKKKIKNVNIILSTRIRNKLFIYSLFLLTKIPVIYAAVGRRYGYTKYGKQTGKNGTELRPCGRVNLNWGFSLKGSPYFIRIGLAL